MRVIEIARARRHAEIKVQVVDENQKHTSGGVVRRPRGRKDDAFLNGGGRRRLHVEDTAAMCEDQRHDLLPHAVLVNLELVRFQIGNKLALPVAGNDVRGHEIDLYTERWLLALAAAPRVAAWPAAVLRVAAQRVAAHFAARRPQRSRRA